MAGKKILILGGGFGGITAALELQQALPSEHQVTLVDRGETFMMGLRKLWVLVGRGTGREGPPALRAVAPRGIEAARAAVPRAGAGPRGGRARAAPTRRAAPVRAWP